jgi:FkbM family methyltransferase
MLKNDFDNRGFALKIKLLLPELIWRLITKPIIMVLKCIPNTLLYSLGYKFRASKIPYRLIAEGDIVLQVGAPRDLLSVGRSRAAYFMKCVGFGKVVVFEPDPESAAALRKFASNNGLSDQLILIEKGAWSQQGELTFLSSSNHPASNLIKGAETITVDEMRRRDYQEISIGVTTIDIILEQEKLPLPKLISITANGSEIEIIKGMKETIEKGMPYISLAITSDNYPEFMSNLGYRLVANDDRGFTFISKSHHL